MRSYSKKGQEEMTGFVLIVVLVIIIGIVFIGLFFAKGASESYYTEAENFIHASMYYSSECYSSSEIGYDVRDLIKACKLDELCMNGESACFSLNKTVQGLLNASFNIDNSSYHKGYEFRIYSPGKELVRIRKGVATGNLVGANIPLASEAGTNVSLKFYY